VRAKAGYG